MTRNPSVASIMLLVTSIVGVGTVQPNPVAASPQHPLVLGGVTIGDRLSNFTAKFPKAVCQPFEKRTSVDDSSRRVCCLYDPAETASLSPYKILFSDKCGVKAHFYQERLTRFTFTVDVSSIEELLPGLMEIYGVPSDETNDLPKTSDSLHIDREIEWSQGNHVLTLAQMSVRGKAVHYIPSVTQTDDEARFVILALFDLTKDKTE